MDNYYKSPEPDRDSCEQEGHRRESPFAEPVDSEFRIQRITFPPGEYKAAMADKPHQEFYDASKDPPNAILPAIIGEQFDVRFTDEYHTFEVGESANIRYTLLGTSGRRMRDIGEVYRIDETDEGWDIFARQEAKLEGVWHLYRFHIQITVPPEQRQSVLLAIEKSPKPPSISRLKSFFRQHIAPLLFWKKDD